MQSSPVSLYVSWLVQQHLEGGKGMKLAPKRVSNTPAAVMPAHMRTGKPFLSISLVDTAAL
jgi:hypothetical protein